MNEEWVFRFPRREGAVPLIETERRLLPFVAPRVPLPIPVPRFEGLPAGLYPWPFLGYALLPGETFVRVSPSVQQIAALAEPLGRFLAALHALPAAEAAAHGAGPDQFNRLWKGAERLPHLRADVERLEHPALRPLIPALLAVLDRWPAGYQPRTDTLIHADLHVEQLLLDDEGRLTGIIDWGDAHLGDPALDVAGVLALLPPAAFSAFETAYGPIDPVSLRVAQVRAVRHTLHGLDYAQDIGDEQLLAEMVRALRCLTESRE